MSNVFQRAQTIRMSGEPWQNAVQRATSQIRYETQMGGRKTKKSAKKSGRRGRKLGEHATTDKCTYNTNSQHCRVSHIGKHSPQFHSPTVTAGRTAHRNAFAARARANQGQDHDGFVDGMRGHYGGYVMEGGRKAKSKAKSKGKKARKPRSVKTDLCHQARNAPGRCHLSPHGSALHTNYNPSAQQLANQDRFTNASAAARADGHAPGTREFGAAFRDAYHGQGAASPRATRGGMRGGGRSDGFSDTSSTRSSDFTSVSDTTSYTMSANSYDSSSLW